MVSLYPMPMSSLASPGENTESPQTGGNLYLSLHPVLVESEDLVDDGVEDALLPSPVSGHDDVFLLLAPAQDAHVEVTREAVVSLVVLASLCIATIDFRVTSKFNILLVEIILNIIKLGIQALLYQAIISFFSHILDNIVAVHWISPPRCQNCRAYK